ncbi:MAG: phosphodiester glycosidase family protein, partial [Acidimicrobiia bacterium]
MALSIVVPTWGAAAGAAALPVPAGFEVSARRDLAPGVEHITLTRRQSPLVMNVARIAPSAPVDLQVVSAFDKVGPRKNEESLEHPTAMCARVGCLVGVNGDFFHPDTEEPFGAVATAGRLLRSPAAGRGQGWQSRDGHFAVGGFPWSGNVTPANGGAIAITGVNVESLPNGVVLYTPDYGRGTPILTTELVVELSGGPVLGQPISVKLLKMADGGSAIPANGAILAGRDGAADALRDLWNRRGSAGPITLRLDADVVETVGIHPVLVSGGRRVDTTLTGDLVAGRHSRTLIGQTADGSLVLATIDDKWEGVSDGVSTREAADLLLALGVVEGGNLDGGGGSTFVVQGVIANRPSDGPGSPASEPDGPVAPHQYAPGLFERTAVNMIAIVPRGGATGGSGTGSGGGGAGGTGGAVGGGLVQGGGLFAPVGPGDVPLFGTGPASGGATAAGSIFAPSPLSSTPLASASALYKIFSLVKAKAAGTAAAGGAPADASVDSTTTTANSAGAGEVTEAAGAGQSAAAVPGDRVAPPSRMPAVMLSLLLLV